MFSRFHLMFTGFIISFLGSLPLGTLNITAFNIAAYRGVSEAVYYALAVVLIELVMVRITLAFSKKINFERGWVSYALPVCAALLLYLSVTGFTAAGSMETTVVNPLVFPLIKSSFVLGLVLSLSNPLHIPFWMGWNGHLKEKRKLSNLPGMYPSYIFGIGIGSLAALMAFIITGNFLIGANNRFHFLITFITSGLYLLFSGYLTYVFIKNQFRAQLHQKGGG